MSLTKAILAGTHHVPFYGAAPLSTIDFDCPTGNEIPIEERSADEVHYTWGMNDSGVFQRVRTTPSESEARNPAFDITPAQYIKGIITEKGIFTPDTLSQLRPHQKTNS